ncbi:hypothetical protein CK934_00435 [Chitinophaga sp. MD30]|nr:hypothetical protein CK934_00435 [Chitinophaga sp. MD30]
MLVKGVEAFVSLIYMRRGGNNYFIRLAGAGRLPRVKISYIRLILFVFPLSLLLPTDWNINISAYLHSKPIIYEMEKI